MLLAQDFPYGDDFIANPSSDPSELLKTTVIGNQWTNDSFVGEQSGTSQVVTVFTYAQGIINIALGLLAFISVIILIYNFFIIFFGKEKEGIESAQKAVKRVTFVILIIGLSWIVVSFLFWVVGIIIK